MRAMKDSGIKWIGEIPEEWEVVPFKSYFKLSKGLNITKENLVPNGIPVISYGQIHSKTNTGTAVNADLIRYVPKDFLETNPNCLLSVGSFIFADTSEDKEGCGNAVYVNDETNPFLFAGYHTIIANPKQYIKNKYLAYLFLTDCWRTQIRSVVTGIKVYSINQKCLNASTIICPPLSEQQRIATYLDTKCGEIDELIGIQEKFIEELKSYKQSVITEAVTKGLNPNAKRKDSGVEWIGEIPEEWEVRRIKNIGTAKNGLTYSPSNVCDASEGTLVLRSSNIQNGLLDFNDNLYVNSECEDLKVEVGDIIICSRNGSAALVGKCAIVEEHINATFGAFMMRFRSMYWGKYIYYLLQISITKYKRLFSTTTVNQLTIGIFNTLEIPFTPNIAEQQQIATYLDNKCSQIDSLIALKQTKIEELKSFKKSLIYEYVTGKKTVPETV